MNTSQIAFRDFEAASKLLSEASKRPVGQSYQQHSVGVFVSVKSFSSGNYFSTGLAGVPVAEEQDSFDVFRLGVARHLPLYGLRSNAVVASALGMERQSSARPAIRTETALLVLRSQARSLQGAPYGETQDSLAALQATKEQISRRVVSVLDAFSASVAGTPPLDIITFNEDWSPLDCNQQLTLMLVHDLGLSAFRGATALHAVVSDLLSWIASTTAKNRLLSEFTVCVRPKGLPSTVSLLSPVAVLPSSMTSSLDW